ncbi:MAG: D-tyrosyl-tRNA(Tyr) deacylase [Zetaproteobacteria bacterium]|nr:MAG: D-tyrosyl-tRNA(Tyr) deacylase [Zetaproteobacteria bacterium]
MRVVVQRVKRAAVRVGSETVAAIGHGMLLYAAFRRQDGKSDLAWMADKIVSLRVFEDRGGKLNLSVTEVGGEILVVSQFTLYADARKGRRPNLDGAAPADEARVHFEAFVEALRSRGPVIRVGRFQETMEVESVNDGPVTILLDSPADRTAGDGREAEYGTTSPQG